MAADGRVSNEQKLIVKLYIAKKKIEVLPAGSEVEGSLNGSSEVSNLPILDPEPEAPNSVDDYWKSIPVEQRDNYDKIARKVLDEIYGVLT